MSQLISTYEIITIPSMTQVPYVCRGMSTGLDLASPSLRKLRESAVLLLFIAGTNPPTPIILPERLDKIYERFQFWVILYCGLFAGNVSDVGDVGADTEPWSVDEGDGAPHSRCFSRS